MALNNLVHKLSSARVPLSVAAASALAAFVIGYSSGIAHEYDRNMHHLGDFLKQSLDVIDKKPEPGMYYTHLPSSSIPVIAYDHQNQI